MNINSKLDKKDENDENGVLAMATGNTYDIVRKYSIHAHPAVKPYPNAKFFFAPIRRGGAIESVYHVITTVECFPDEVYNNENQLAEEQFSALVGYHEERKKSYGYGKTNTKYRFYVLEKYADIIQPFEKKNIRISIGLDIGDIPLKLFEPTVSLCVEYQGNQIQVEDLVSRAIEISGKSDIENLAVYFQPENEKVYYSVDGIVGSFSTLEDKHFSMSESEFKKSYNDKLTIYNDSMTEKKMKFLDSLDLGEMYSVSVHKDGRTHLFYKGKGFALLDFRKTFYRFSTRETYMRSLSVFDYTLVDYQKKNNAVVILPYSDNSLVRKLISFIKKERESDGFGLKIHRVDKKCIEESEREERDFQSVLNESTLSFDDTCVDYVAVPEPRKQPEKQADKGVKVYPRNQQRKIRALARANYLCEFDESHESFISRSTGKRYLEPHHLIPLEYWESFKFDIDVEANIVCLCSNCHNEIHYGAEAEKIIKTIYKKRLSELDAAGIGVSIDNLLKMYDGSFVDSSE